ncbi:hypothetical protein Bbelb_025350 [Branchiostoma belcheri]|nr:hypothetical protein Bbelb_025350 [Branchiostoma belcheri]
MQYKREPGSLKAGDGCHWYIEHNIGQLDRLVNRAARLITGHKLQDHVSAVNLRAEAGIDSVRKRTEITTLVNVFKAIRGSAPVYIASLVKWETPPTLSVRTTRSELKHLRDYDPHLLFCPPARATAYWSSLQYYGSTMVLTCGTLFRYSNDSSLVSGLLNRSLEAGLLSTFYQIIRSRTS